MNDRHFNKQDCREFSKDAVLKKAGNKEKLLNLYSDCLIECTSTVF